jgi:hypothetical protein
MVFRLKMNRNPNSGKEMTAAEVFSAFMDAQQQDGYQYFVLVLPDDWVDGYLQEEVDEGVFSREHNPHLWR